MSIWNQLTGNNIFKFINFIMYFYQFFAVLGLNYHVDHVLLLTVSDIVQLFVVLDVCNST